MAKKSDVEVAEVEPLPEMGVKGVVYGPTKVTKDMLLKDMWNRDARNQLLSDETLEPHKHLALVLLLVFLLAIFLSFVQL